MFFGKVYCTRTMQHQQYAEEQGLLGSLCPGQKKLEGKTFYLDSVKKRPTALLLETVFLLGGVSLCEAKGSMPVDPCCKHWWWLLLFIYNYCYQILI